MVENNIGIITDKRTNKLSGYLLVSNYLLGGCSLGRLT